MGPLTPVLAVLTLPIAAALYFVDMPKLGKPRISSKDVEPGVEHTMDLRPLNREPKVSKAHPQGAQAHPQGAQAHRVYLTPSSRTPVS